ncbi:4-amino-4-deoxy-L-arabinose transferase-like glycosyltransferase [Luteibacter jiangsuensis]|uniref:4-amino-4-deoxy-L-arabinose transferase-like glycosyltransferase n=1 Tax=Luteibacter jiangsuensis TaxID=637577 RepID=A0ABT9SYW0_9GAMM|nr:hypothetical protein [Luteibacter jiangsuensis]MDQ0010181.1 4-amino-4-deoxy-L-arabinose transferase-like glycosyltransferase [Luteibacter jiangsuensis]
MNRSQLSKSWQQVVVLAAIALLALAIRLHYVHTAVVDHPLRGDATQYFSYAWNVVHHRVFSIAPPESEAPTPDSFRDPGYPIFLAGIIALRGDTQAFYTTTLDIQAILSALTVALYTFLARRWLGFVAAVTVGLGLTFWPHSITLAGYLLSETLVGFFIAVGLWCLQLGLERRSRTNIVASGIAFAAAGLTNAVIVPAAPLFAGAMAWRDRANRARWLCLLLAATLPCAAWILRSSQLPPNLTSSSRVAMNFVQGSWPEYHSAWFAAISGDPAAKATLSLIDNDITRLHGDRLAGVAAILERMERAPMRYLAWYASKPVELWGWSIGIGQGDIYVYPTFASPLTGTGPLRSITDLLYFANPFLMLLALAGVAAILTTLGRREPALVFAILLGVYATCVFTVLQADARYAVPYRGIEWVAIAAAIVAMANWSKKHRPRRGRFIDPIDLRDGHHS